MCAGGGHEPFPKVTFRGVMRNLRAGDRPLPERLGLIGQAAWRRLTRARACCGYYGEPGC